MRLESRGMRRKLGRRESLECDLDGASSFVSLIGGTSLIACTTVQHDVTVLLEQGRGRRGVGSWSCYFTDVRIELGLDG